MILGEKKPIVIFYFSVFIIMFILTSLTPMVSDDYSYCFSFYDDTRISSVSQIIPSMIAHRQILNGRVIVHGIVQFFLMFPKTVFNTVNGLNSVLLCFLLSWYLDGNSRQKALSIACGAMALWSFLPGFGQNFLWLDGAINYAWGYSVFFAFLWPYSSQYLGKNKKNTALPSVLLYILLSFVAGSYSENASFIFLFLAVCLTVLIWHRDHHVPFSLIAGMLAELGGWLFLINAPASSHRSADINISILGNNLAGLIKETESFLFWFLLIDVLLLIMVVHFQGRKEITIISALFIIGGLGSVLSFTFAAYHLPRHYCCTGVLLCASLILCLNELFSLRQHLVVKLLAGGLAMLFAFRFSLGVLDIAVCWHKAQVREQIIHTAVEAGEESVTVDNCIPMTNYALKFSLNVEDPVEWPNAAVASFYGIDEIYGREPS